MSSVNVVETHTFFVKNRNAVITLAVLVFHALAIWALQAGLVMRAVEMVVPVDVLAQIIDLPTPKVTPAPPAPPEPVKKAVSKPTHITQAAPTLLAVADAQTTPNAPSVQPITPPASYLPAAPVAAASPQPPAKIVLPSSDADYLSNPKPPYPPMSKRLGEQGKVIVRVLIGSDGLPQKAELRQSSGFDRLDQSALATIMRWRYVPGKRDGLPEAMWFNVPISFVLE
ncbi:MAG TPA: TonB family protein [Burkholderiaceae bacterium]|mgnify:CR=1 FL=1|nr:TonB family protein [Burkholderiaceae bacterium]